MFNNMSYVYCVYREGNFCKAANKLHISQPSLSAMIRKIEQSVGAEIFDRRTRPISLTSFGIEYIQSIERVQEIENYIRSLADNQYALQNGNISIGGSNMGVLHAIPRKIAQFQKAFPEIKIRIVEATTEKCKYMLDNNGLDVFITNRPLDAAEYLRTVCFKENLILAVPKDFSVNQEIINNSIPLNSHEKVDIILENLHSLPISRVAEIPFVLLHSGNYLRLCTDKLFKEHGITPKIVLEAENSATAFNFANMGVGATIFSSLLMEGFASNSNCYFYKLAVKRETYLCYRHDKYLTSSMEKFMQFMLDGIP